LGEQDLDESQTSVEATSLEDLLKAEARARTPDFDPKDEDVFDLELDPEVTAGLFACDPDEYSEMLDQKVAEEMSAVNWRNEPRFVQESGRYVAQTPLAAPAPEPPSWLETTLIGLIVVNALLIGMFLIVPEVFHGLLRADPVPTVEPRTVIPRVGAPDLVAGPTSGRERPEEPRIHDANELPDRERYESAQHWIGRGHYEKATSMLEDYVAAHPALTLLQRQAVFSSLMYCAQRLGDTKGALAHFTRVESLRYLSASPEDLWAEASAARSRSSGAEMRQLYARVLLQSDRLEKRWEGTGRIDSARTAFCDSYRFEARTAGEQARRARVIR
jgi:hypothetical protein